MSNPPLKKGLWTTEEDMILTQCVLRFKEGNWSTIALKSGLHRSGKSCRLRWVKHLSPNVKNGPLSDDEQAKVIRLQAKHGNKWAFIANHLPGRSDNTIKNFWNSHRKRTTRAQSQQQHQQRTTDLGRGQSAIGRGDGDGGNFGMGIGEELFPDNLLQMGSHGRAGQLHEMNYIRSLSEGEPVNYFTSMSDDGGLSPMGTQQSCPRSSSMLIHSNHTRMIEQRSTVLSMGTHCEDDRGLLEADRSISEGTSSSGSCVNDTHGKKAWHNNMTNVGQENSLTLGMRPHNLLCQATEALDLGGQQPMVPKRDFMPCEVSIKKEYMSQEQLVAITHPGISDFGWMQESYNGSIGQPAHDCSFGAYGVTVLPALDCSEPGPMLMLPAQHRPYPSKDVTVSISGPDMYFGDQCTTPTDMLNSRPLESPNLATMLLSPKFDVEGNMWVG